MSLLNALEGRDDREASEGTDGKAAPRAPGTVREALCKAFGYGPPVVDRAARLAGLDHGGAEKLPLTQPQIDALLQSLGAIDTWFEGVSSGDVVPCGVVTWRRKESDEGDGDESPSLEADFEDFSPFPFDDFPEGGSNPQFDKKVYATASVDGGFDGALDLFFASFEARRDRSQREKSANAAAKKLEKVKRDQEARGRALEKERLTQELAATLIEYNLTQVDAVLAAVNGALGGGMAWEDLTLMIKEEARAGNPVAGLVKTLDLPNNKVTVTLKNHLDVDTHDDDEDDDADTDMFDDETEGPRDEAKRDKPRRKPKRDRGVSVELDLALGAHANAREHFDRKKKHDAKHGKTLAQNQRAVAAAEKKARDAGIRMANKGTGRGIARARVAEWFEKFHWFVTNENCLVLHARDAAQADALVTKYLGPDDAFVHADSPAAPVTIVKAPPVRSNSDGAAGLGGDLSALDLNPTAARGGSRADGWCGRVPPVSLIQAGAACLCRSSAWDSRHVVSAFWIPPENVRKVTPTGDPLAVGVVWHVGQKTFLPPAPLVMGFGCVFLLGDEAGVEAHRGDRVTKSALRSDGGDSRVKIDVAEEEDGDGEEEIPEEPEAPTEEAPAVGNAQLDAFLDGGVDFGGRVDTKKEDEEDEKEEKEEDEEEDKEEPNYDDEDANNSTAGKVRISAKERRLMKKQRKKGDDGGSDDDVHDPIKQTPAEKPAEAQPQQRQRQTQQPANANKPLPRGKSSKAKKAAKKYADQDDEDRELAIALARASGKRGKKGGKGKGGGKGGDSSSDEDVPAKAKQNDSRDRAESNRDKSARQHGAGAGKEGGHARAGRRGGQDGDDDEPVLEDPAVFAARDVERMSRVDWFTGAPTESDAIDFAVCVVAPYQALQSFRYKVKLTPGTQKKGKAGKQALDILCKAPASVMGNSVGGGRDQSREEKELLEGAFDARCKEMMRSAEGAAGDLAQLMCGGGVKVSMPAGAAKAMNAGRKGKR